MDYDHVLSGERKSEAEDVEQMNGIPINGIIRRYVGGVNWIGWNRIHIPIGRTEVTLSVEVLRGVEEFRCPNRLGNEIV